jgi:hypothetical protein
MESTGRETHGPLFISVENMWQVTHVVNKPTKL